MEISKKKLLLEISIENRKRFRGLIPFPKNNCTTRKKWNIPASVFKINKLKSEENTPQIKCIRNHERIRFLI